MTFLNVNSVLKKYKGPMMLKHHKTFDFGQVQTATEHFYIFIDRIQRWMNIFLAFFLRLLHRRLWQFNQALQGPISAP